MDDSDYRKLLTTELPDLTVGKRLGRGGQGLVFAATNTDGRKLAIKVLFAATVDDPSRFGRDLARLKTLRHENVVQILDHGVLSGPHGKIPFLLMPYVDGLAIDHYCRQQSQPVKQCVNFFVQICDALAHAHQNNVIHRDVKPGNVLIDRTNGTPGGRAWVLDFCMANMTGEQREPRTGSAWKHAATLQYMSPEQVFDESLDVRTDIYSLGVLMYDLLGKRSPYPSTKSGGLQHIRYHIRSTAPPSLRTLNPAVNADLSSIVHRCLEKNREQRYASIGELRDDLERWQRGEHVKARSDSKWYHFKKTVRRHWLPIAASLVIAFLLAAGSVTTTIMWQRAERQAERADAATIEAENLAATYGTALQMGSLAKLGSVARDEDRTNDALTLWRHALEVADTAPMQHVEVDLMRHAVLHELAEFHLVNKDSEAARTYCADAIAIAERYAGEDLAWRRRLGFAEILRGRLALADKNYEEAIGAFGRSVEIRKELVEQDDDSVSHRVDLAHALSLAGRSARKLKRMDQSLANYTESYKIRSGLHAANADSTDRLIDLVQSEAKLGLWHLVQKTTEGNALALEWINRAGQRLSEMQAAGQCDDRPRDCRILAADLAKNRGIVERRGH